MTQPRYAKVDPADYKRLRGYEWSSRKGGRSFYALRYGAGKGGNDVLISMHQDVIEVPEGMVICLGTQFKWKICLRFCVRFLTLNVSILLGGEKP